MIFWYFFYIIQKLKNKNDKKLKEKLGISTFEETTKLNQYISSCKKNNQEPKILWFHAESIGESFSIVSLIKKLYKKNYFIIFTTNTNIAKQAIKEKLNNKISIQYFPYPNHLFLNRFYQTWKFSKIFFVENEIYPNILSFAKKHNIKTYLLNARMSNNSFKYWAKFKFLIHKILIKYDYIFTSSKDETKKFLFLSDNYKNIECIGNLKISSSILNSNEIEQEFNDIENKDTTVAKCKLLKKICENRKIILFGSIHSEEFFHLIWQYIMLSKKINLIAIFAPRHLEEVEKLENLLMQNNITTIKWSNFCGNIENNAIIIDTIGELSKIYNICDIAIVCGSFVNNIGGHNPLEPISLKKITFIGQYYDKCANVIEPLLQHNAIIKTNHLYFDVIKFLKDLQLQQHVINSGIKFLEQNSNIDDKIIAKLKL